MDALALEGVSKSFDGVQAVASLDLHVPEGSIYGFLGPNGAGKTTTIRMVVDIIRPDSGVIRVLGQDTVKAVKDQVGYMPEERGLYPRMAVRGVLEYLALLKGVARADVRPRIDHWLKAVDLAGWADRKVHDLSRGMQQRLQFVAAVVGDPRLVILDEPFSGLDPVNLDLLKGIVLQMRGEGATVILSTHMMEQAESLCDAILLINDGRKVLDGSLADVRVQHGPPAVVVELEGDGQFIEGLPTVVGTTRLGKKLQVVLREDADDQEFLAALVGKVRVLSFARKVPSLHEVFVSAVRGTDA
jgi:ABC-2 type transport system ATP-binding protein